MHITQNQSTCITYYHNTDLIDNGEAGTEKKKIGRKNKIEGNYE
jgi:hypothetical protein